MENVACCGARFVDFGSLLGAFSLVGDGSVEDGVVEAGYVGRDGCGAHVEDDDLVRAFLEPWAGNVEGLLGADVPEASDGVAVDPDGSFAEGVGVEEGIASLG